MSKTTTPNLKIADLKSALRGKRYQFFSGWNGTFRLFIIKKIQRSKANKRNYVIFGVSDRNPDFKYEVTLTPDCMADLLSSGHHEEINELDHCLYRDHHTIL